MNDLPNNIDDRKLDQLVDGELSQDEYRQLLVELDQAPEGWRRCAHAFLESQALGQALPLVMQAPPSRPQTELTPSAEATPSSGNLSFRRMEMLAAMAACVAVAFGLGWFVSDFGMPLGGMGQSDIADVQDPPGPLPTDGLQQAAKPQFVYLNQWDGVNGSGMPIPIDPTKKYDPKRAWDASWGMTPQQMQQLQKQGHQLETHNRMIPISMDNGDQVVVPMQEVIVQEKPPLPFH